MKLSEALKKSGVSAIIYGRAGIGKTHFVGTLPGKTLIIAAEANGLKPLARSNNIDNIEVVYLPDMKMSKIEDTDALNKFFDWLFFDTPKVDNIVLDSATELRDRILLSKTDRTKNDGVPTQHDYGACQKDMERYLKVIRDLSVMRGINTFVTALEREMSNAQNSTGSAVSSTHPLIGGDKFTPAAEGYFDIIAHLESKDDGTRFFRLDGNECYVAKDRVFGRKFCLANGEILLSGRIGNEKNENTQQEK